MSISRLWRLAGGHRLSTTFVLFLASAIIAGADVCTNGWSLIRAW